MSTEPDLPESVDSPPSAGNLMNGGSAFESLMLVLLFVGAEQLGNRVQGDGAGLKWAIVAATVWGMYTMVGRWRRGLPIGRFLPLILAFLVVRGALGVAFDSEDVYFGIGIGTKVLIGTIFVGSVVIGRPLAAMLLPFVFPFDAATRSHAIYRSTMVHLTLVVAAYEYLTSVWDVWLLANSSASGYVVIRSGVGMVTGFLTFFGSFWYAKRRLDTIPGFEGTMAMLERMSTEWSLSKPR
ncbi:MAG: hypothetical protein OEW42_02315 [Acidimicrobiia bacterium]|nr:hypothetical protein [Acidimicrobiia bacterium]